MADSEKAPEQQQEEQQQQEQTPIVPKETVGEFTTVDVVATRFHSLPRAVFRLAKWKMPVSHFVFPKISKSLKTNLAYFSERRARRSILVLNNAIPVAAPSVILYDNWLLCDGVPIFIWYVRFCIPEIRRPREN